MDKILKLLDADFAADLFRRGVLPLYPEFRTLSRVEIKPYKKLIWETTYHVVIGFAVYFLTPDGTEVMMPIVCSAHSDEPRENVYQALRYLWARGLPDDDIDLPTPLFYSEYFRGVFYRGLPGESLLYYIKQRDEAAVADIVARTAALFARLHALPTEPTAGFTPAPVRLRTVVPGVDKVKREMSARYQGKYDAILAAIYDRLTEQEEKNLAAPGFMPSVIHGDAHPENIIRTAPDRIGLIDFTDLGLGDRARDVGGFLQQLEYKIVTKLDDAAYAIQMKDLFLSRYLAASGLSLTPDFQARIDLYYNWTALRTAIYWFLKSGHSEERARELFDKVKSDLRLE